MPPHIQILDLAGDPAGAIAIAGLSGGQTSATTSLEIWNDKLNDQGGSTTAQDLRVKMLAASGVLPYISGGASGDYPGGIPALDERWSRFRIVKYLVGAVESDDYVSGTMPIGTNSEIPLPDLAPQTGVRVEFFVVAPAGQTADALKIKLRVIGNEASSPLSPLATLAHGSGVIPADRQAGVRALLRGGVVTANDTATVSIAAWLQAYDGTEVMKLATTAVMTLADGGAVNLLTGESYLVTLSITSAGVLTVTKGLKAEQVTYPSKPAADIFLAHLEVTSADGIAVAVAQASVDQSGAIFGEFSAASAGGLTLRIHSGQGITGTDFRQFVSHTADVTLTASATNRVWRLAAGTLVDTLTDVPPEVGADLLWLVTTDATDITVITDARKFAHRAIVEDRIELRYQAALSQLAAPPVHGLALAYAHGDFEIERVELNLSGVDASWTAGSVKIDVLTLGPGVATPFPAGGAGGTSIFTSSATDDRRPSIAYNATVLRAVATDHEVRRIVDGTRLLLSVVAKPTAPAPEPQQEIRVTLHVRRYR